MIVYWTMFILPALVAMWNVGSRKHLPAALYIILMLAFFFIMGWRESGGDFATYLYLYGLLGDMSFAGAVQTTEPIYGAFNWIASEMGWGIYGVNAMCAAVFLFCLDRFARHEPVPMLTLAIATAYLIIVVAIGYTRQGVAIGLVLWGTVFLRNKQPVRYLVLILCAVGFHSSAALMVGLAYFALDIRDRRLRRLVATALVLGSLYGFWVVLADQVQQYVTVYLETDRYESDGALVRIFMSLAAAVVMVFYWRRWPKIDRPIWSSFAAMTFLLLPLMLVSTTVADRVGLYTLPLQLVVFGRLPAFQETQRAVVLATLGVLVLYGLSLFVWLNYSNFAEVLWLPYISLILGEIS